MVATPLLKIYTGSSAGTMNPAGATDATNWNLMSTDAYDSTGSQYQSNPITVPETGTSYSYEKWMRLRFDGTFNLIDNIKTWKSAGTLSDVNLSIKAGVTTSGVTPKNTASSVATNAIPTAEGSALELTPTPSITSSGAFSRFLVAQLNVPNTVVTPGDIGTQTLTFQYDES